MSLWTRLFSRRKRMMEALDEGIRDFIERETQDNIDLGLPPQEAHYAALRKFGNVTRVREETRDVWTFIWLEQLWQDVRFGLRMLAKNPGFKVAAFKPTELAPLDPSTDTPVSKGARKVCLTAVGLDGKMKNCDRRDSAHCERPIAETRQAAHVPKWRNWQTRYIQGVVPVREWRFESSLRHLISYSHSGVPLMLNSFPPDFPF